MNWKIVSAFVSGALIASLIVYMAVKPGPMPPKPPVTVAVPSQAQIPPPPPPSAPPAVAAETPAPAPTPAPVREKPSPMPPPVRRERHVMVARNRVVPIQDPTPQAPPESPQSAPTPPPEPPPPPPVAAKSVETPTPIAESPVRIPNVVVLAAGTTLQVRIGETLSASRSKLGDSFLATLEQPLVIDGFIIAERGSRVEGRVVEASLSRLSVELVRLSTSDGQRIQIRTEPYKKYGSGSTGSDLAKVGAGAAIGAAIGGIAGGGKGAAIGAGAGAVVGAGTAVITSGRAEIPVESRLSFRVQEALTITEKLE
jgi:hypothetical protein